uniref:Thioredoxin domain-containing protein n=2 Tax=Parascaris univalens TaxID=6257 RepID=A0A915BF27_PARUN
MSALQIRRFAMILRIFMAILSLLFVLPLTTGAVTYLDVNNYQPIIKSAQVVFVAFCADWCPFSQRLKPIFEKAAETFAKDNPTASVVWAIVDSVQQAAIADKYFVNKYPTMKVFINGELATKEYRASRTVEALTSFVSQQLASCIHEFTTKEQLEQMMDKSKRNIIAYYANRDSEEYSNFNKAASILREDCAFYTGTDPTLKALSENMIIFRDPDTEDEQKFSGNFSDYEYVKQWLTDKCIPLVREVTFENVEELTEEGLPFLLFFRDPADKQSDKRFTELVIRELFDQKGAVNALLADAHKFAHPLKHLGKTENDLPVLAIDSFQHMFLFHDMNELDKPGKLREFVLDLHSGKLHKDFHATLDQKMADLQKLAEERPDIFNDSDHVEVLPPTAIPDSTPPPSVFKELKPSEKRYSLLKKTEL